MANHYSGKRVAGRKPVGKRALSLLMALVMSLSLVQITAFAAETGSEDQIMPGYYEVDANGNIRKDVTTTNPSRTEGGYTLSKTIAATSVENQFNITLQVVTQQTVKTNDAAVQLVIDTSGSMKYCAVCGVDMEKYYHERDCTNKKDEKTRLEATQEAIAGKGGFLDSLVAGNANGGKLFVSVAQFSYGAEKVCDWVDITAADGLQQVKDAVNGLEADGGTNLEAAMMLARNRLQMDAVASAASKYTVLLTDGEPTYRCTTESVSVEKIDQGLTDDGSGSRCSEKERNEAKDMATQVKELSKLYTICYGVSGDVLYGADKCVHCGKTQKEHNEKWFFGSVYYCRDNSGNTYKSTAVTIGDYLRDEIATPKDTSVTPNIQYAFNASDTAAVNAAFANIASSTTEGINASGTTVTDPMGEFIVLGTLPEGATASNGTLTWSLGQPSEIRETTGQNGEKVYTYIYTYTYPITLDTSAEGFEEGKYYPTNGPTYLSVPGSDAKYYFNIPGVKGTVPTYGYRVEYYLQGDAALADYENYTKVERDTIIGPDTKLHTTVSAPAGYAEKYDRQNYAFEKGETQITIAAGENVMKLYYKHITAPVTVNHYYKLTTIDANGTVTEGVYPENPQNTVNDTGNVGEHYQAALQPNLGNQAYELDNTKPNNQTITVDRDSGKNVIDLYYTATLDQRADATVTVDHVYRLHTWELVNGEYELVDSDPVTVENVEGPVNSKATATYTANTDLRADGYQDYTFNKAENEPSLTLKEGANKITLYFDKTVDDRVPATVTVNHHYTKTVTSVEDGKVKTTTTTGDVQETFENCYVGESFTATEKTGYQNETYVSDPGNAGKLTIAHLQESGNVIDLAYTLTIAPEKTSVTVNHYYYTETETTKEVKDPETGEVTGTEVVCTLKLDSSDEGNKIENLYVGQEYTAELKGREGYTLDATEHGKESDPRTGNAETNGASVVNLRYYKSATADKREKATIDVQHVYVTHLTTIVNGEVKTVDVQDGIVTNQAYTGKAGDSFKATPETTYKEQEYTVVGNPVLSRVLQPGTNDTIVIHYERNASDLVATTYTVNYEYRTYTMTVENGVAREVMTTESGTPFNGNGYVNQVVTLPDGARNGFTALSSNPATRQTLQKEGNTWTFVYERHVDTLEKVNVTVNHHYTLTTIAVDGSSKVTNSETLGQPAEQYKDTRFTAKPEMDGYTLNSYTVTEGIQATQAEETGAVSGIASTNVVVNFYYSKTDDMSQPATLDVRHIYRTYDWKGNLVGEPLIVNNGQVKSFATKTVAATADAKDFTLAKGTLTQGQDSIQLAVNQGPAYAIVLKAGANQVVFEYEKHLARPDYEVKVIHEYYYDSISSETEGRSEENLSKPVESKFQAELRTTNNGIPYEFVSATPEGRTITVSANTEDNVITIKYVRAEASYAVVHEYYTNGSKDGASDPIVVAAKVGDVVKAEEIAKVMTYGDNTYTYTSADPETLTVAAEGSVITLRYDRTYNPPVGPSYDYYTVTVNYYDKDSGEVIHTAYTTTQREYTAYDVTAQDKIAITGYTYVETTGDALTGTLNGNKVINVYYTKDSSIDDGNTPTDPGTDIGDDDVPVTPAKPPKTGDSMGLWIAAAMVSGMGLIWLSLSGKKRKEEI